MSMPILYTLTACKQIDGFDVVRSIRQYSLRVIFAFLWANLAIIGYAGERHRINNGWLFHLGDIELSNVLSIDSSSWRSVYVPHDWSIESTTDPNAACGGNGGFFSNGIGWYQKELELPDTWKNELVSIEFEGVYQNAEVWLNDTYLGKHPYGYTPFTFPLSPHVRWGGRNVLTVRVDNSQQPNSRWYSGSGIYRHVWLNKSSLLHLDDESHVISTKECSPKQATLIVAARVDNELSNEQDVELLLELLDSNGTVVNSTKLPRTVGANEQVAVSTELTVTNPRLWSPSSPELYQSRIQLFAKGQAVDSHTVELGIRTVTVSSDKGLLINEVPFVLFGANIHHDLGPLGGASFDRAEERRIEILKSAGFNAVRTAHNPPSSAMLRACDRQGMLVVAEAFDGWKAKKTSHDYGKIFDDWWRRDLAAMVKRDRNHPSVVMWSVGNEMYERGKPEAPRIAGEMVEVVKKLDPTRPVAAGVNGLGPERHWRELDALFGNLDVAGYNYELHRHEQDHLRVPRRVIMSAESYPCEALQNSQIVMTQPHVIGDFVWSGMDYLGESGIGRIFHPDEIMRPHWEGNHFPWHGGTCGDIDLIGQRKPYSHYRNIVWNRGEKLFMTVQLPKVDHRERQPSKWAQAASLSHWTWPKYLGEELSVEVYSRYTTVKLYLNEDLVGEATNIQYSEYRHIFKMRYQPGTLKVVGIEGNQVVESFEIKTAGKPSGIRLSADRTRIRANGQDLSFIGVEVVDESGVVCPQSDVPVKYSLDGPGTIAAIGSGDLSARDSYAANPRSVFQGRALLVVRSSESSGAIVVKASSPNLSPANVTIDAESPGLPPAD